MLDKQRNWWRCTTPISLNASTNTHHGTTCMSETIHHIPGTTRTSTTPGTINGNWRIYGGELNWKFIGNYMSPPVMNALFCYPHAKRITIKKKLLDKANNKTMFRLLRSLDGQLIQQLPEFHSTAPGCELFSHFFSEKIDKLLSGLQCFNTIDRSTDEKRCFTDCIHVFDPTTNTKITAICGTTDKTCVLDHLPPNQLRDNITSIVSVITMITNTSPDEAVMPWPLKHAIVRRSLKKPSIDKDILINYQPVSNLTQLSKVIEKVVAFRIMTHVSDQQMVEWFQLAYRKKPLD